MSISLHDLVGSFISRLSTPPPLPAGYKVRLLRYCADKLDEGYSLHQLNDYVRKLESISIETPFESVFSSLPPVCETVAMHKDGNLLKSGTVYTHLLCREEKSPVYSQITLSGEIEYVKPDVAIQLKNELYVEDVLEYFYEECSISKEQQVINRDLGAIHHLLRRYTLDQVLYGIDIASESGISIQSPLDLEKYNFLALSNERIEQAKGYAKEVHILDFLKYR